MVKQNNGGVMLTQSVKDLLMPYRAQGQSW